MARLKSVAVVAALAATVLSSRALAAGDVVLVGPGVRSAIIIGEQPRYRFPYWGAHAILQRYLMLVTRDENGKGGVTVPIIKDADLKGKDAAQLYDCRIWVGDQARVREMLAADLAKLDDDGFIIRCVGNDVYVCGKNIWGTHWAPYELLERFAGCRWYMASSKRWWMPQEDGMIGLGDVIPRAAKVQMPADTNIVEEPAYKMRWFMAMPTHSFRERYRDRFHHALVGIMPPQKYGQAHPEYYPEIKGKRCVPAENHAQDFQPCISNPAVVDLLANAAIEHFDTNPDQNSFSVGMNDSANYCECSPCQGMAPADITEKNARIAYSFFVFYNRVAEKVARRHPDKRLGCLAYAVLKFVPPGSLKLHPMIVPYLTVDSAQLWDPPIAKLFHDNVDKWSKLAARMGVYEYIYGSGFLIPRIYNRYLIRNIQERYGVGVDGFYAECGPNWGLDGPKYWLIDKMLWNNRRDPQKLLDDYYANMFGPAADAMRRYFDYLEEVWCTQPLKSSKSNYRWMDDIQQLLIFPPEKCDAACAMLEAADKKVRDLSAQEQDAEAKRRLAENEERIRFFKTSFAFTRMMCMRYAACKELEAMAVKPPVPFAEAMRQFQLWGRGGSMRAQFEAVAALKVAINAVSGQGASLASFRYNFDKSPGPASVLRALTEELVARAVEQDATGTPEGIRKEIDDLIEKKAAETPGLNCPDALTRLGDAAKNTGFLFVRPAAKPPALDGVIRPDEWGQPAYAGGFYEAFAADDRVPHRTTIYAVADAQKLYLAFDCEADTKVMAADVAGRDTDDGAYPKMAKDDAVSVSIVHQGAPFHRILVNLNGSIQDGKRNVCNAATGRTGKGWQAEMEIPLGKTPLNRAEVAKSPTWLGIARYYRVPSAAKGPDAACSTLSPVARVGNSIGNGNHETCMCFTWGPRVVYPKSPPPKP